MSKAFHSHSRSALSLAVATAIAMSGSALAQQAPASDGLEEITVSGFRASLINAIETKRDAAQVVEAVSAEDIGKLPDSSIAESLSRLPGLAGQRVNGRTSAISIRGFGQDFTAATLNGRELLGMGDNRGVEFDLYPSEILAGVTVYKTPTASLTTQGIAGTVDLRTVRPLESKQVLSAALTYEQNDINALNPDMDDKGYRGSFSYVDQFADDTIGVALTVASMESPSQEEWWQAWGYADSASGNKILGGHKSYARSAMMNRDSVSGVLEFKPSEKTRIVVDALYIDYLDEQVKRGLETPGPVWGVGGNYTETSVERGLVTAGRMTNDYVQIRNDSAEQDAQLTAIGLNWEYQVNDSWKVAVDAARSDIEKRISDLEIYSGFGRGEGAGVPSDTITFKMTNRGALLDYSLPYDDYNLVKLAGAKNWGFDNPHCAGPNCTDDQDGFLNYADFDESLTTLRAQADAKLDGFFTGLHLGLYFSDREKSKKNVGLFLTDPAYPANSPIPQQFRNGVVALDFLGGQKMVAIDGRGLYASGYYLTYDEGKFKANRQADTYTVREEVKTAYVQADYATGAISGNIGLQMVKTDQSASGYGVQGSPTGVIATPYSDGKAYTDLLPSFNLAWEVAEDHIVRAGASRTMTRSRMDKLRPGSSIVFNPGANIPGANLQRSPWSASSGNPQLEPIKADMYDLSYEWYFANDGYLSASYYIKDLVSWQTDGQVQTDFTPFYYAALGTVYTYDGYSSATIEAGSGQIKGYELQASVPFRVFADALDGFGLIAYYTKVSNSIEINGNKASITGLSDKSYGVTAYYEKGGFQVRVSSNYRSDYTAEVRAGNNGLETTRVLETDLIDAQVSYDFGKGGFSGAMSGLSVFLSGTNLGNEPYVQFANNDVRQITRYSNYGSNYMLGARYKF